MKNGKIPNLKELSPSAYCNYLGNKTPIYILQDQSLKKAVMSFDGSNFICTAAELENIDLVIPLKSYYVKASRKLISKRLKHFQAKFKENYKSFTITSDDTRWGTCDSKRQLTFNWKLLMFPLEAIDYVVIHELCHLSHMNHDRSFWRLVGKHCPNYKEIMPILGTEKTRGI